MLTIRTSTTYDPDRPLFASHPEVGVVTLEIEDPASDKAFTASLLADCGEDDLTRLADALDGGRDFLSAVEDVTYHDGMLTRLPEPGHPRTSIELGKRERDLVATRLRAEHEAHRIVVDTVMPARR